MQDNRSALFYFHLSSSFHRPASIPFLIMGKKKQKKKSVTVAQALQRKLAKQQGFYDGRFKEKTVRDKKKEWRKKLSRMKVKLSEEN